MTSIAHVTTAYATQYADPIAFKKGDRLVLTGRSDNWNGHTWLWAIAVKDGREGWIPDSIIDAPGKAEQQASIDYSARELTCSKGESLILIRSTHGWHWCENQDGKMGWVPDENLQIESQG